MTYADPKPDAAVAVTRFGLGARPGEIEAARSDPRGWLKAQIRPSGADQPAEALPDSRASVEAFRASRLEVRALKQAAGAQALAMGTAAAPPPGTTGAAPAAGAAAALKAERRRDLAPVRDEVAAEMLARTRLAALTPAGFSERWTLFWANHFTVSAAKLKSAVLAGPFEREAIRPHVFGRFEDLLVAASTHPGMLLYLDQARSVGPDSPAGQRRDAGLNENLGREILELHTVGADGGYTQADVTEFARALTGYSVGAPADGPDAEGRFLYRARFHEPGARTVLGRSHPDDGQGQARRVLADLAARPQTAARLSHKLAAHFVADDPPPALVARLQAAWLRRDGDLSAVAAALVDSPEAWSPTAAKFKTPNDFVVSAWRAAGTAPESAPEALQPLVLLGQRPFSAPQPNGWSDRAAAWATGAAVIKRLDWSRGFAEGHAPAAASADLADAALGDRASPALHATLARAESRPEAFAILLMSPEFQRR